MSAWAGPGRSERASNGIYFYGFSWGFPTLEWRTPLYNSSPHRQLESLSPARPRESPRPVAAAPPFLSSVFLRPGRM